MQGRTRTRPRQLGVASFQAIACLVLSEWLVLLSHGTCTHPDRPAQTSWSAETSQQFPIRHWEARSQWGSMRLRGGAPRRTARSRAASKCAERSAEEQSDSLLPDVSQSSVDSGGSSQATGTRRSSRSRASRAGSVTDPTTKSRSSLLPKELQSARLPKASTVRFSGADEQTAGDVTPADRGSRVSFRDITESGRKIEAETPTREVFTYTPESIAKERRREGEEEGERMESLGTPVMKGRRRRTRKVQLTPLGARYAERESQSMHSEWSEEGLSVDQRMSHDSGHSELLPSSDSVASRTRSRAVSEEHGSEPEPSSLTSRESSWPGAEERMADDAVPAIPVAPPFRPTLGYAMSGTEMGLGHYQAMLHKDDSRADSSGGSSRSGSRSRRKYTGEAVVYDGGWLVPHKDNWQVPCDIVGCDGKACKAWARKQQREAKFAVGDRVRTSDGAGTVIDKDGSARPLRVRIDATEEEGWYKMSEVRKTFLKQNGNRYYGYGITRDFRYKPRIWCYQKDDTLLSASAFGLSMQTHKELSQSGTADISASSHPGNPDVVRAETIPEYAASSREEARKSAYGPYKDTVQDQQTLQELEEQLGIENLQIRMWPMVLRSDDPAENEKLRKQCPLDPSIVGRADSDRARAYGKRSPEPAEPLPDDLPPFLRNMAEHTVENEELVVQPLDQEIVSALGVTDQEAKYAADIFRRFVDAARALRMNNVKQLVTWILGDKVEEFLPIEVQEARVCQAVCELLPHWTALPDDVEPHLGITDTGRGKTTPPSIEPGSAMDDSGSGGQGAWSMKQVRRQLFWDDDGSDRGREEGGPVEPSQYKERQTSYNGTYSKIGKLDGFGDPVLLRDDWSYKEGAEDKWDREPKSIAMKEVVDILRTVAEADELPPGKAESADGPFFEYMSYKDILRGSNGSFQDAGIGSDSDEVDSSSAEPPARGDKRPDRASDMDTKTESEPGANAKRRKTRGGAVATKFDYAKAFGGLGGTDTRHGLPDASSVLGQPERSPAGGRSKIALVGGFNGQDYVSSVDTLDVDSDSWTVRASSLQDHSWGASQCGSRRGFLAAVHCQDRVYAIGGFDPAPWALRCDVVESFDVSKWKRRLEPSLTQPRSWHAATSMGGSIMVVGGNNGTHHTCSAEILRVETAPSGPRAGWTAVQSMSYKRYAPAACSVGGRCIAAGGYGGHADSRRRSMEMLTSVESYDGGADRWLQLPSLLYPNSRFGLVEARGRIYAVGGFDGEYALDRVISYDPRTKFWTAEPSLCVRRSYASTVVIGDCIYALGGFNGELFSDTIEVWDTRVAAWTPRSKLPFARAYMGAAAFSV